MIIMARAQGHRDDRCHIRFPALPGDRLRDHISPQENTSTGKDSSKAVSRAVGRDLTLSRPLPSTHGGGPTLAREKRPPAKGAARHPRRPQGGAFHVNAAETGSGVFTDGLNVRTALCTLCSPHSRLPSGKTPVSRGPSLVQHGLA